MQGNILLYSENYTRRAHHSTAKNLLALRRK